MNNSGPPPSFGVCDPASRIVVAFRAQSQSLGAEKALLAQGFASEDLVAYTPAQMSAEVDAEVQATSPLALYGQEFRFMQAHRGLAQCGCSFLVVHAPDDARTRRVAEVARAMHAVAAQRYGQAAIEELIGWPGIQAPAYGSVDRRRHVGPALFASAPTFVFHPPTL